MKKSLPYLTALAAFIVAGTAMAQSPSSLPLEEGRGEGVSGLQPIASSQSDHTPVGDRLLVQAAAQLERRASVTARLRHEVAISGQQLYGVGNYWQQGSGEALKVRLELQIAGQEARLLQVCNSRFMWVDRTLPTGRAVTRIDLRHLRADPSLSGTNLNDIRPGDASWSSLHSELTEFTGGMPKLLTALRENFTFLPPQAMRLAIAPPLSSEPMNVPVFAVVGHWQPERLAALLAKTPATTSAAQPPAAPPKSANRKPLPERLPEEVLLLVGQSDLFPYRIEYRRLETPDLAAGDGPPIPYQLSTHPLVVLELSDVTFDTQIAAGQFDYAPGEAPWVDETTAILERLRQEHQAQVAIRTGDTSDSSRQ